MITCRDDDLHAGACLSGVGQEFIVCRLGGSRRIAVVEHVPRYHQGVRLMLLNLSKEPLEKMFVLWQTVVAVKQIAEVPVAGCQYLHAKLYVLCGLIYCKVRLFFHIRVKNRLQLREVLHEDLPSLGSVLVPHDAGGLLELAVELLHVHHAAAAAVLTVFVLFHLWQIVRRVERFLETLLVFDSLREGGDLVT